MKSSRINAALLALAAALCVTPSAVRAAGTTLTVQQENALPEAQIPKYILDAVNSPDRPANDKSRDSARQPAQLMAFFGIKPGMQVADLWAAGGYTTELLARVVGPSGKVYSQNPEFPAKFAALQKAWQDRLKEPGMSNVTEVSKPFGAPDVLPVAPNTLDAVLIVQNYHDLVGRGYDRQKLNAAVFKALKPGGIYGVVDNSAQAGSGPRDAGTLHRIDEAFEIKEIEQAGFTLTSSSSLFRNPKDDRTLPAFKLNHLEDRFVLKFIKQ
jgi:predicted methyltransferase